MKMRNSKPPKENRVRPIQIDRIRADFCVAADTASPDICNRQVNEARAAAFGIEHKR